MSQTRLKFESVSRRFTSAGAGVHDLSFELGEGEVLCLLGPSGSGKSTTLRLAAGLEHPDDGEIVIDGKPVAGKGKSLPPEKRGVGLIFQDFALFPHLTVLENVAFGLRHLASREREPTAKAMLKKLGLGHLADAFPNTLSGGEQQRVALGRALAPNPRVMLMDEPFSDLNTQLRDQVRGELLSILRSTGAATILVTHDPEEALRVADRILLLRNGYAHQLGTAEDLYFRPVDQDAAAFFGEVNTLHAIVQDHQARTPLGTVSTPEHAAGVQVEVLARPTDLEIVEPGAGTQAEVLSRRLAGGACLLELKPAVADLPAVLIAQVDVESAPVAGSQVHIALNTAHSHVFPCRKPL